MTRAAVAFAVTGLLLGVYFVRRGPSVETPSTPLTWSVGAPDAGSLALEYAVGGVDFFRATDAVEPVLTFAVVRRGDRVLVFDDFNAFLAVEVHDGRLWALGERQIEGPGPSLELLVSEDEGRTFEHRASVPKPNYLASFEGWTVAGDDLTLVFSVDDELLLHDAYVWPWWRPGGPAAALDFTGLHHPTIGPGRFALHSKNGGRRWRLER